MTRWLPDGKRFLRRAQPSFDSILVVESGPRKVTEQLLPFLYNVKQAVHVDLLTCYSTPPDAFDFDRGVVYSVHDREARENRGAFIAQLASGPYTVLGLLCTGSPILEKWKWVLAFRSPARLIAISDGTNYFGLEIWNHRSIRLMLFKRLNPFADYTRESLASLIVFGLSGLFLAPFTVAYLALYTAALHLRRWMRRPSPLQS